MTLKLNDPGFLGHSSGAGSVTPASYGTLIGWWKADSFALSDGTAIGGGGNEWVDQSSSGLNLSQASAGSRPLFKTNIFGSMPAIRYDASNDFLDFPSTLSSATDITVVGICTAATDSFLVGKSDIAVQYRIRNGGNNLSYNTGASGDKISDAFTNASTSIRMNTWRGNVAGATINFRENKTDRNTIAVAFTGININKMGTASFAAFYDGDMAEVCIWATLLNDTQLDSLYTDYFQSRWGLP